MPIHFPLVTPDNICCSHPLPEATGVQCIQPLLRFGLGSAFALAVSGCVTGNGVTQADSEATSRFAQKVLQSQREKGLQSTWRGRPYDALIDTYGSPALIMNVPGYRPLKTSVVVYGVLDKAANCIDAFTLVKHG